VYSRVITAVSAERVLLAPGGRTPFPERCADLPASAPPFFRGPYVLQSDTRLGGRRIEQTLVFAGIRLLGKQFPKNEHANEVVLTAQDRHQAFRARDLRSPAGSGPCGTSYPFPRCAISASSGSVTGIVYPGQGTWPLQGRDSFESFEQQTNAGLAYGIWKQISGQSVNENLDA
jgi:hypothetical protein